MLLWRGTIGVMLARSRAAMFSTSSHQTLEWPLIKKLIRTSIVLWTQDWHAGGCCGAQKRKGRSTFVDKGRIPERWCCNSALPRASASGVRVSTVKGQGDKSEAGSRARPNRAYRYLRREIGDGSGDGVTASWYSSSLAPAAEGATCMRLCPEVVTPLLMGIGIVLMSSLLVSTSCSWSGIRSASCMLTEYEDATEGVTA